MRNGNLLKMRVSEIRVNQIRVNQGLGVTQTSTFINSFSQCLFLLKMIIYSRPKTESSESVNLIEKSDHSGDSYQYFLFLSRNMNVLYNKVHISKVSYVNHCYWLLKLFELWNFKLRPKKIL